MTPLLVIQAMNVHVGGGRSLLLPLLEALGPDQRVIVLLDQRMKLPPDLRARLTVRWVRPTLFGRWSAERWLKQVVTNQDTVLCFGNLPPLFAIKGRVLVFVQNRFLIDRVSLASFRLKTRLRLMLERLWFRNFAHHGTDFAVQTPSMCRQLVETLSLNESDVQVWPFSAAAQTRSQGSVYASPTELTPPRGIQSFIFPASGDPHKNHRRLIQAWILLAKDKIYPPLYLTLDKLGYPDLCAWIEEQASEFSLNILNLGFLPQGELLENYSKANALIYPSLLESFGLPLIEAKSAGLAIIAAELDYVRDILDPEQTFDPMSSISIARAVRRYLCIPTDEIIMLDAKMFLDHVLKLGSGNAENS